MQSGAVPTGSCLMHILIYTVLRAKHGKTFGGGFKKCVFSVDPSLPGNYTSPPGDFQAGGTWVIYGAVVMAKLMQSAHGFNGFAPITAAAPAEKHLIPTSSRNVQLEQNA